MTGKRAGHDAPPSVCIMEPFEVRPQPPVYDEYERFFNI